MTCSYWRGLSLSARECSLRKRSWNKTELAGNIRQLIRNIYEGYSFIIARNNARARSHSRLAVRAAMPSVAAASASDNPAK